MGNFTNVVKIGPTPNDKRKADRDPVPHPTKFRKVGTQSQEEKEAILRRNEQIRNQTEPSLSSTEFGGSPQKDNEELVREQTQGLIKSLEKSFLKHPSVKTSENDFFVEENF